jgi:hypothetical protein
MVPLDGQCIYYAARQLGYRMGIGDDRMTFPWCAKDSPCSHYHLAQGTNANPFFQFPITTSPMSALLQIRAVAGELSPDGSTVFPFFLDFLGGNFNFYPAPLGLVQQWLNPDMSVGSNSIPLYKTYSGVPNFSNGYPLLNEMVGSEAGITATLANIRPLIVMAGMEPKSGNILAGTSYNAKLGVSGDGTAPGFIGIDSPYIQVSRLFSSKEAIRIALGVATIQCSFPATRTSFQAHQQSALFPLMAIGVQDFGLTGSQVPLAFYTTQVTHHGDVGSIFKSATTEISARLLGQAN